MAVADWILFPLFFLAVWLWVVPSIDYAYPGFWRFVPLKGYTGWFLSDVPYGPGKLSLSLASIVAPSLASPFTGALVITAIAYVVCFLTGQVLSAFGLKRTSGLKYVPAMILLFQYGYVINPLPISISVIIGLTAIRFYQIAGKSVPRTRIIVFLAFAGVVITAAIEAFLIFVAVCIASECVVKRNYIVGFIEAAIAACLPAAITLLFFPFNVPAQSYTRMVPQFPEHCSFIGFLPLLFWLFFPCIGIIAIIKKPIGTLGAVFKRKIDQTAVAQIARNGVYRGIMLGALMAFATAGIIGFNHEVLTLVRPHAAMNHAMVLRDWDRLLDEAGKIPVRNLNDPAIHLIDRALYHKGRLLEDLFKLPQSPNALLPYHLSKRMKSLGPADRFWGLFWGGWTYFELGFVNTAEHYALEALSQIYYPPQLQLLAMIYSAKAMPEAGRTCLMALSKDPAYHSWAATNLAAMESPKKTSGTQEIESARSFAMSDEFIMPESPPLADLFRENRNNRMAFEYLIAMFLILRQVDSVNTYCKWFRELDYPKIPRPVQEAIVLSMFITEKKPELFGYRLDDEAMASFERFFAVLYKKYGGRTAEACDDMAAAFGDSYYFYYIYGLSKGKL